MDWDEGPEVGGPHGPYEQMARLAIYKEYADKLIAAGQAFRCYCTKGGSGAGAGRAQGEGSEGHFRYPGTCRDRKDEPDARHVVRFKAPTEGSVTYVDKVFGEVTTPTPRSRTSSWCAPTVCPSTTSARWSTTC